MPESIAQGWDVYSCTNGEDISPPGNRMIMYGQTAIFEESFLSVGENEDQAVDHAKWCVGGRSTGLIWVSNKLVDLSFWTPGATSVVEVGAKVRTALTTEGFTLHVSTDDTEEITYPAYDIAIIGTDTAFATLLTLAQRKTMLTDFVNDGGALMLIESREVEADYIPFSSLVPFNMWQSGGSVNPGDATATLVTATGQNATLFPSGRTVHRKLSHYVSIGSIDAKRQEYSVDGFSEPFRQYAVYSDLDDA